MDKIKDKELREKGYEPVEEYIRDNVLSIREGKIKYEFDRIENILRSIRFYQEASEQFHGPGGDGYQIVQRCLRKYLDYKFIRENNRFRFSNYCGESEDSGEYVYTPVKRTVEEKLRGSRADIFYLLHQADQNSAASRRCRSYVDSNKLHLTSVLIFMVEKSIEAMDADESERIRVFGKLLRTAYLEETAGEVEASQIYTALGYSKTHYYRLRSEAITFLSECLFGVLAGESGLAELYIDKHGIIIPAIH